MEEGRRRAYLEAIGVQLWQPVRDLQDRWEAARGQAALTSPPSLQPPPDSESEPAEECPGDSEQTWTALEAEVAACRACPLHQSRTQTVFGCGSHRARWMVIGEAPGASEDQQGQPFVGRAGQLLTEMLRAVGLRREDVFIANILKCRPPQNRDPQPDEVAACESFLQRQVALVNPALILAVGRVAAQNLLQTDAPLGRLRGRVHHYREIPVVVVYHPAYLLRSPLDKRKAWEDLLFARSLERPR